MKHVWKITVHLYRCVVEADDVRLGTIEGPVDTLMQGISLGLALAPNDPDTSAPWQNTSADTWVLVYEDSGTGGKHALLGASST